MHEVVEHITQIWTEKGTALTSLAGGADLILAGITEQGLVANVADYHGIPMAGLHFFPAQVLELGRLDWRITKEAEDARRLRSILTPQYATRAREVATQMTNPTESLAGTADLLEQSARQGRVG